MGGWYNCVSPAPKCKDFAAPPEFAGDIRRQSDIRVQCRRRKPVGYPDLAFRVWHFTGGAYQGAQRGRNQYFSKAGLRRSDPQHRRQQFAVRVRCPSVRIRSGRLWRFGGRGQAVGNHVTPGAEPIEIAGGNPCQRRDAVRGASSGNPKGGPLLAQRGVARQSLCYGMAPSSRLALSQNRLRHGVQT